MGGGKHREEARPGVLGARLCEDTNTHIMLVGIKNGTITWGNEKFVMSYKITYTLKITPSNPTFIYFLKSNENLCSQKPVCEHL